MNIRKVKGPMKKTHFRTHMVEVEVQVSKFAFKPLIVHHT